MFMTRIWFYYRLEAVVLNCSGRSEKYARSDLDISLTLIEVVLCPVWTASKKDKTSTGPLTNSRTRALIWSQSGLTPCKWWLWSGVFLCRRIHHSRDPENKWWTGCLPETQQLILSRRLPETLCVCVCVRERKRERDASLVYFCYPLSLLALDRIWGRHHHNLCFRAEGCGFHYNHSIEVLDATNETLVIQLFSVQLNLWAVRVNQCLYQHRLCTMKIHGPFSLLHLNSSQCLKKWTSLVF